MLGMCEEQYIRHIRRYKKYVTSGNTGCEPYQDISFMSEEQYILHMERHNAMYATSRNTKNRPHKKKRMFAIPGNIMYVWKTINPSYQETQCIVRHIRKYKKYAISGNKGLRHIRKCYVSLKKSIHATPGDTIYWMPHQEMQKVRHIQIYSIYAISGNAMHLWRAIYTLHQEIQEICHIRKYRVYTISGNAIYCTPHQKYKKYVTSGNTWYTPYQEMLRLSEEQYLRRIRRYNILYAPPRNTKSTPHQGIQCVVLNIRKCKKYVTPGNIGSAPQQIMLCMSEWQHKRHIRRYNILYATLGNTKCKPHQDIQDVRFIRKCNTGCKPYLEILCIVSRGKMEHGGKMEHRVFGKNHARRGSIFKFTWFLPSASSASCMEIKLAIDHVFSISQKRNFTLLIYQFTRVLTSSALTN